MILDLIAVARQARFAVLFAGMAWLFGIAPPPGLRIALVVMFAAACVIDQWLTQPHRAARVHPQRDHLHPVA